MKIIVSRFWRIEMWSLVVGEIFLIILSFVFWNGEYLDLGILFAILVVIIMTFWQITGIILEHRFLSHVMYNNNLYTSFFVKKKLCEIDGNEPIYYTKIYGRISAKHYAEFILISQSPFDYCEFTSMPWFPWQPKPLLYSYNIKKMILLPYEENAPYLSKLSEWTRIYPKANI